MIRNSEKYKASLRSLFPRLPEKRSASLLITGATGLIGSCLADALLLSNEENHTSYSLILTGRSEERLRERFSWAEKENTRYLAQDINEPVTADVKPDFIIHAASNADPVAYALYPAQTLLTNIYGTKNMLDLAVKTGARLLLTSTFEVYGKIEDNDVYSENMSGVLDLTAIRSCYPESKRSAELLLRCYVQQYGVSAVIARLSSIYGPTMLKNDSKAHVQFIRNGLAGENIVLKSEGKPRRTYTYVIDAVAGLLHILMDGVPGEAYNVSNEKSVASIAEVAGTVARLCGTKVVFDLPDAVEARGFSKPQNCILDNAKLRALGFSGKYTLEEGLGETIGILRESNRN